MYCEHCGAALQENARFCTGCGAHIYSAANAPTPASGGKVGYSSRIHDPAFARYVKNNNRWSAIFSMILAVTAVIGFYIYGETSYDMENPQALNIGVCIGGMFLVIAFFQILGRKRSKTWDGVVVDKTIKNESCRQSSGSDDSDYYINYYTEYAVIVQEDGSGKTHRMTAKDDDTYYNYFQIGDRVRHHAELNSYEKYDKSKDSIIFCSACSTLCEIDDEYCYRCKCPLLK